MGRIISVYIFIKKLWPWKLSLACTLYNYTLYNYTLYNYEIVK